MAEEALHLPRHEMVWVEPDAWSDVLFEHGLADADPLLSDWAENRCPLVVRSHLCGDQPGLLSLGLPFPPSHGKRRFAFRFDEGVVDRHEKPPFLAQAAAAAPQRWRKSLSALVTLDPYTRCFGSLAWEFLTRFPYLSAASDLDLLWRVGSRADADYLAREIARIDAAAPVRLDGEFLTPEGAGIQWREWHAGQPDLLVKTRSGPQLIPREQVFA